MSKERRKHTGESEEVQAEVADKVSVGSEDAGDQPEDLSAALQDAMDKLHASEQKVLRLAADFDNTRKRLEREKETLMKYAEENLLRELLPGIDNLERAMDQGREAGNAESLLEGLDMTRNGILETLEKFGVTQINSVGEPFDPNIHEAVAMEEDGSVPPNTVVKEFQKGYQYKDRLLRAAKVIVSKAPAG